MEGSAFEEDGFFRALTTSRARRRIVQYRGGESVAVPCIEDLIRTKRWSMRPKDLADIELLKTLKLEEEEES